VEGLLQEIPYHRFIRQTLMPCSIAEEIPDNVDYDKKDQNNVKNYEEHDGCLLEVIVAGRCEARIQARGPSDQQRTQVEPNAITLSTTSLSALRAVLNQIQRALSAGGVNADQSTSSSAIQ